MANTQSKNTKRNQKKKLLQSKLLQLIKRAVEHIKVNTLRNTRQLYRHQYAARTSTHPYTAQNQHNNELSNKDKY